MRILVAPDSFKGALSAKEAAAAIAEGVRVADERVELEVMPVADGGEGLAECLVAAIGGHRIETMVRGPLGGPLRAAYALLPDGTAVIEAAAALGLSLLPKTSGSIVQANSWGLGDLIRHAVDAGADSIVVGLGGSGTNDGGIGLLSSLGVQFMGPEGPLSPVPLSLQALDHLDLRGLYPPLSDVSIRVACDVDNPLCGSRGATAVYGPQKGVAPLQVPLLDAALARFACVVARDLQRDVADMPGAGAAGGVGAAFAGVLGTRLERGIDLVLDAVGFDEHLDRADWVITGEGRTDSQSAEGKVVHGIARRARAKGIPVLCLSGEITLGANVLRDAGVTAMLAIPFGPCTLQESMERTRENLSRAASEAMRLILTANLTAHRPS
ncbi:MAG: glycerate kinase [Firmicutes bacterium]|nr:glycerate kinase [Bacillota bacterium]